MTELALPGMHLRLGDGIGRSRFGGPGVLPAGGVADVGGAPALLDLVDLAPLDEARLLPTRGLPGFFYAGEDHLGWVDERAERDGWRVLLCDPDTAVEAPAPHGGAPTSRFTCAAIERPAARRGGMPYGWRLTRPFSPHR